MALDDRSSVAHAPQDAERLARTAVHDLQKSYTAQAVSAPCPKRLISEALATEGVSLQQLAGACGVSKSRAAAWLNIEHDATPNLGHIVRAQAGIRRRIAEGLLVDLDQREASIPVEAFEREAHRAQLRLCEIVVAAARFQATGDEAGADLIVEEIARLRDHLRRLERTILASKRGRR